MTVHLAQVWTQHLRTPGQWERGVTALVKMLTKVNISCILRPWLETSLPVCLRSTSRMCSSGWSRFKPEARFSAATAWRSFSAKSWLNMIINNGCWEKAYFAESPRHMWLSTRRCYLVRECLTDGGACKLVLNDRQPQVASSHQDRHLDVVLIRDPCRWIQVQWLSHTQKVRERNMSTRNGTFLVVLDFLGRFSGLFLCFLLRIRHLTCEM